MFLDGGGVRGYATLIILKKLMDYIGEIELKDDNAHRTSYGPFEKPKQPSGLVTRDTGLQLGAYANEFLPCHYFGRSCKPFGKRGD
jgi:hypothetical protein